MIFLFDQQMPCYRKTVIHVAVGL